MILTSALVSYLTLTSDPSILMTVVASHAFTLFVVSSSVIVSITYCFVSLTALLWQQLSQWFFFLHFLHLTYGHIWTHLWSVYSSAESAFLVFSIFSSITGTFWILWLSIYFLLIKFCFPFIYLSISFSWSLSCSSFFVTSSALHISIAFSKFRFDPFRSRLSLTWFDLIPSTSLYSISPSLMSWTS